MSERVAVEGRQPAISPQFSRWPRSSGCWPSGPWSPTWASWGRATCPVRRPCSPSSSPWSSRATAAKPLWDHVGASLFRALVGFAIGVLAGVPFGLFSGYHKAVGAMMSPIMAFSGERLKQNLR